MDDNVFARGYVTRAAERYSSTVSRVAIFLLDDQNICKRLEMRAQRQRSRPAG